MYNQWAHCQRASMICTATPDWHWVLVVLTSLTVMFFVKEKKILHFLSRPVKFFFLFKNLRNVYCKQPRGLYIFATSIVGSTVFTKKIQSFLRFCLFLFSFFVFFCTSSSSSYYYYSFFYSFDVIKTRKGKERSCQILM